MAQLPAFYKIRVNVDMITDAVTFEDPDTHERVSIPRWLYGPGYHYSHDAHHDPTAAAAANFTSCEDARTQAAADGFEDFSVARTTIFSRWSTYVRNMTRSIPIAARADLLAKIAKNDVSTGDEYVAHLDQWINDHELRGAYYISSSIICCNS